MSDDDSDDSDSESDDTDDDEYERDDVDVAMGVGERKARMKAANAAAEAAAAAARGGGIRVRELDGPGLDGKKRTKKSAAVVAGAPSSTSGGGGGRGGRCGVDDEEMFYEDGADDADQEWASKARGNRVSDAILSCPCCLEIVTIDCQRHVRHLDQWRAMFVQNVRVDTSSVLRFDPNDPRRGPRGASAAATAGGGGGGGGGSARAQLCVEEEDGSGPYNEAFCETCNTLVGVRDADEVYHFFHVFPSTA